MHIGFGKAHDIESHHRMKQDGEIYAGYLDDQQERQVVDCVNAELIRPYPHSAKGVDTYMNYQKSSDW